MAYIENFCAVTKRARIAAGYSETGMAEQLNIPRANYQTYEDRELLPMDLISRFCELTNIDIRDLFDRANNPPSD